MALYFIRELEEGARLALWAITEELEELFSLSQLVDWELHQLLSIKSLARRREKLAVREIIKELFGKGATLMYRENGAPYIKEREDFISISHTKDFAVVLTHPHKRVGVDIESLSRDYSVVEKRVLSQMEREYLQSSTRLTQLAIIWSAKESLYKLISQEGVDFAKELEIAPFKAKQQGDLVARGYLNGVNNPMRLRYELLEGHVLCWIVD